MVAQKKTITRMEVTRFGFSVQKSYLDLIYKLCDRCTNKRSKLDTVMLIEGAEGMGKTSAAIMIGYIVSEKTGRKFGAENVFFDIDKMMKFAQENEGEIIIWDEPALSALSTDKSRIAKDFERFMIMGRKRRHFIIMNITHFERFNTYAIRQRAIGMTVIYERRRKGAEKRFIHVKEKALKRVCDDWERYKKRTQFKHGSKFVRGSANWDVLNPDKHYNVLSEWDDDLYNKMKDEAIMSIGNNKAKGYEKQLIKLKYKISMTNLLTIDEKVKLTGNERSTIYRWKELIDTYDFLRYIKLDESVEK